MAKIAVRAISTLLIFAFAFTAILPAAQAQASNNLSTDKENKSAHVKTECKRKF